MEDICSILVECLSSLPSWILSILEFLLAIFALFFCFRYFGKSGIYTFTVCIFLLANLQALRQSEYFFQKDAIALGTIAFSVVFLGNNILVEYYGIECAKNNIYISFFLYLFFTLMMILTLSYSPKNDKLYLCFREIFQNSPRFLIAGTFAYFVSQFCDVHIFNFFKKMWPSSKLLWLRNNIAILVSGFLDNVIFSSLAWKILPSHPVDFHTLFFTYILGTYWLRVFVGAFGTPILYLSRVVLKNVSTHDSAK